MNARHRRHHAPGSRIGHLGLVLVTLVVAACAGAAAPAGEELADGAAPGGGQYGTASVIAQDAAMAVSGYEPAKGPLDQAGAPLEDDAKIIRSGSMQLQVEDVDAAVAQARQAIAGLGGYIGASRTWRGADDRPLAEVTYRIPADRWEEALAALRGLAGKVISEQTDAIEVTGQLVDLEARIRNLRAGETALVAIAATAVRISDVLEVQARLTEVRGQIEQLEGQRADLSDRVAHGTMQVAFGTETKAVVQASEGWDPAAEVDRALARLVDAAQSVTNGAIWFAIVWVPTLLLFLVLAAFARLGLRRAGVTLPSLRPAAAGTSGWTLPGGRMTAATSGDPAGPPRDEPPVGS